MENLLNRKISCTDPDTLQFCLPVTDKKYWYCEPNVYHDQLLPKTVSIESFIYDHFLSEPFVLLDVAKSVKEVMEFIQNPELWLHGEIDVDDFTDEEQRELLDGYGYAWEDFDNDAERKQIICEIHFESYPMDYRMTY